MSKNNLDKIFRNKLADMQVAPSESAAAKFESALARKHKKPIMWWQIAAAVAVLGVATITWYGWQGSESTNTGLAEIEPSEVLKTIDKPLTLAQNDNGEISTSSIDENQSLSSTSVVSTNENEVPALKKAASTNVKPKVDQKPAAKETDPLLLAENQPNEIIEVAPAEVIIIEEVAIAKLDNTAEEPASKIVPIITITYIPTSHEPTVATTTDGDQERPSFKSILLAASNVALMAELREAKDGLLSSPFSLKNRKVKN